MLGVNIENKLPCNNNITHNIFDIDNMCEYVYIKLSAINATTLILGKQLMVIFSFLLISLANLHS